ncbi:DUF2889 domain-containing protein [Paraburkholderia phosphatilytica]|uniref:DUF2889 domain-containing protein n=1 Tax=Paraburkholderia phosphatilytica TaxID=2282883 RepID=UPI000E4B4C27|nr:DUF2889 domain-containing protein [Paraburkholderia phosphatilytica]
MPLSSPVSRQLRHRRAIRAEAYERADGLWDIEACLTDEKPRDTLLSTGVRPKGLPIHELWLRITIDTSMNVVGAEASSDWVPYPGLCEVSNPAYRALIGLNLLRNFRRDVARVLGGTTGCTHLTELCAVLPTAAVQAFAGTVWNTRDSSADETSRSGAKAATASGGHQNGVVGSNDTPPFQLGRCHALRFDGEAVRQYYPRWYGHPPHPAKGAGSTDAPTRVNHANGAGSSPVGAQQENKTDNIEVQSNSQTEGITHEDSRVPG